MADSPRVAMVAGETSGDLLAGLLIDGMQAHWPGLQSSGIGGPQMARRGFTAWWPSDKLAVHGYSMEVLRRLRELLRIRKQLRERLLKDRPDVFIGVDAPDFNLGLEADLRAAEVAVVPTRAAAVVAAAAPRVAVLPPRAAGRVPGLIVAAASAGLVVREDLEVPRCPCDGGVVNTAGVDVEPLAAAVGHAEPAREEVTPTRRPTTSTPTS